MLKMVHWFVFLLALCGSSLAIRDHAFRFKIPARQHECFYENYDSRTDKKMDLFYEVIQGGNLDIKLSVSNPEEMPIYPPTIQKKGGLKDIPVGMDGPYRICLDNTFSHLSDKIVSLNVIVHELSDHPRIRHKVGDSVNDSASTLKQRLSAIKQRLTNVTMVQRHMKSREARHRMTALSNQNRVFTWSLLQTIAMVTVFALQVVFVRCLFRENKRSDGLKT